jgi:hypothetical protein
MGCALPRRENETVRVGLAVRDRRGYLEKASSLGRGKGGEGTTGGLLLGLSGLIVQDGIFLLVEVGATSSLKGGLCRDIRRFYLIFSFSLMSSG